MGLSVSAYSHVKQITANYNEEIDEFVDLNGNIISKYTQICIIPDFADRALEFSNNTLYDYDRSIRFSAGSYSGYGHWRSWLAEFAGYQITNLATTPLQAAWMSDEGPFWELINFSDCEGTIGTEISQKLLKDFQQFSDKLKNVSHSLHVEYYNSFQSAFEIASQNGFVKFS